MHLQDRKIHTAVHLHDRKIHTAGKHADVAVVLNGGHVYRLCQQPENQPENQIDDVRQPQDRKIHNAGNHPDGAKDGDVYQLCLC